jgi:hypothetical protein
VSAPPIDTNEQYTLKELNAMRDDLAKVVFVREQIKAWETRGREDAERDVYAPPFKDQVASLAEHVYCMAWARKRDKLGRAERDAGDATIIDCGAYPPR